MVQAQPQGGREGHQPRGSLADLVHGEQPERTSGRQLFSGTPPNAQLQKGNPRVLLRVTGQRCSLSKRGCYELSSRHVDACVFSPTAESFGDSAQIGSRVVRGGPEVRFHEGSTRPGFHEGSTRVPRGSARAAGWCEH